MEREKSVLIFTTDEYDVFLCSGGIIRKFPHDDSRHKTPYQETFEYVCACYGLPTKKWSSLDKSADAFMRCNNLSEFEQYANKRVSELERQRERTEKANARILDERQYLHEKFAQSNMIVGFSAKDIRMFASGFSISINLITRYFHKEQTKFCKENQEEIVKYIRFKLKQQENGRMKKCADLLPYMRPVEMIIGKNEVTVIFELKEGLQKILTSETGV